MFKGRSGLVLVGLVAVIAALIVAPIATDSGGTPGAGASSGRPGTLHMTVLERGKVHGAIWKAEAFTVSDTRALCMQSAGQHNQRDDQSACGFANDFRDVGVNDIDTDFHGKELAFGPAPEHTRYVFVGSFCKPGSWSPGAKGAEHPAWTMRVGVKRLPQWAPRRGFWWLYLGRRVEGSCVLEPLYYNAAGQRLRLGYF